MHTLLHTARASDGLRM